MVKRFLILLMPVCACAAAFTFRDTAFVGLVGNGRNGGIDCSQCVAVSGWANTSTGRGSSASCYDAEFGFSAYSGNPALVATFSVLRSASANMSSPTVISDPDAQPSDLLDLGTVTDAGDFADGPQPNTTYYYRLDLTFANGCPAKSSGVVQVDMGCHADAPNQGDTDVDSPTAVTTHWADANAISKITVRWGLVSGVYTSSHDVLKSDTSYQITGLTTGVLIYIVIDTDDGNGCTARSNEVSVTPTL